MIYYPDLQGEGSALCVPDTVFSGNGRFVLAGLRDPAGLAQLPADEQQAWNAVASDGTPD
ncbi:MAG TPA: hypothetical protein VKU02_26895 [Gemmataceae bacterium]|nr:hypothetical protein [Gemmataceae bacterium]